MIVLDLLAAFHGVDIEMVFQPGHRRSFFIIWGLLQALLVIVWENYVLFLSLSH